MKLNKKALAIAVAAAMAPGFASAADVSGFADIIYTITDDANKGVAPAKNSTEGKFTASGEVDFSASPADGVTVRVDVDLSLNPLTSASDSNADGNLDTAGDDSGSIEQAFFAWAATEGVTVIGGVFNNPIGYDAEDAPDMNFTTHDVVYGVLDNQTALDGDNVAGLAVAGAVGPVTITGALLNDLGQSNEENSIALIFNASPIENLDLELGFVTQDDNKNRATSAEDVTDFNVVYTISGATIGLDYLTAGKLVDSAYALWAGYDFGNGFGAKVRIEEVSYEASGTQDTERTTMYLSYQIASNLSAALEVADGDNKNPGFGVQADKLTTLELIATF